MRSGLLFERFVSEERREPPDIDVDFEHERREEVIQWIYETYGRDRAALTATVIRYRSRGAVREVGKAMGLPEDVTAALAGIIWAWSDKGVGEVEARELNLNLNDRRLKLTLELANQLIGTPRHLSQHPGGFVLTQNRLDDLVPIEPAAMENRQVIEWDKDDIDALKFMKVDVLGLGMLGCMRRCFDLLAEHKGVKRDLATVPPEDEATYEMIRNADTVGVFQIESRAQMAMLPRMKPKTFYDLVIEVAIVRPGPIQGDMVHPFLRRREGREPITYPTEALKRVLEKTLGVPLFQEQAMQIAIVAAGFTPSEADQLRRAMGTFKFTDGVKHSRHGPALSAEGRTVWVLILRLNSSCRRSMALVVRALFHWLGGSRANANRLPPASSRLSATARCRSRHLRKKALRRSSISALKLPTALGNHDATLQENGAELVDQGCPLADRAAPGTMQDLGSLARRPSRPAGPFPKMVRKLPLELLRDTDGKLHLPQTLRCRLSISLITPEAAPLRLAAKKSS